MYNAPCAVNAKKKPFCGDGQGQNPTERMVATMRVITGSARGRRLQAPPGLETRPTSEMTKEAIFSILTGKVEGAKVLDLFAGSGQLGVEALSRGAALAVFVDNSRQAQAVIRENLNHTKLGAGARVVAMDALAFLQGKGEAFDIALLDPPYGTGLMEQVLPLVAARMAEGGVILCESERTEQLPDRVGRFALHKEYRYGKAKLTAYRMLQEGSL